MLLRLFLRDGFLSGMPTRRNTISSRSPPELLSTLSSRSVAQYPPKSRHFKAMCLEHAGTWISLQLCVQCWDILLIIFSQVGNSYARCPNWSYSPSHSTRNGPPIRSARPAAGFGHRHKSRREPVYQTP